MKKKRHTKTTAERLYAVILAGGSGTRFWPLSRKTKPKQFLPIIGRQSLLQQTIARIVPPVAPNAVYVIGTRAQKDLIKKQTKLKPENLLFEPCGRNTAPAICWAAARLYHRDKEAVMAVLPSDHVIADRQRFVSCLKKASVLAGRGHLVTMGIVPTRAETGYGYIRVRKTGRGAAAVYRAEKFIEKPSLSRAKRFVAQKSYLWNSGMFVWRCDVILEEFRKYLPGIYKTLTARPDRPVSPAVWRRLPSVSVDYGILEKSRRVATVPAAGLGWSDLGSWEALAEMVPSDEKGNHGEGKAILLDCRNTFIRAGKRTVAAVGLEDIVIVDTDDALLVCRRDCSQGVRAVVTDLRKTGPGLV